MERPKIRGWDEVKSEGMLQDPLNDRVDKLIIVKPFPIKEINLYTVKRLVSFAQENTNGHWGQAIEMLLGVANKEAEEDISDWQAEVEQRLQMLEVAAYKGEEEQNGKKIPVTFGHGG